MLALLAAAVACHLCFAGPDNMVFDASGNAYVTDSDGKTNARVVKIAPDGHEIASWRIFAITAGRRNGPEGIAIDADGNIYVTDAGALRVLKVSPSGEVLGRLEGDFSDLGHIAIDRDGNIYVAEAKTNVIRKYARDGKRLATWRGEWKSPETIATRPDGTLAVEDWGDRRVLILSPSGEVLARFGHFTASAGLAVDRDGNIYVPDEKLHNVQEFDASGKLLTTISGIFEQGPTGVAMDRSGDLYSPDGLSVVKYTRDGHVLARWR